MRQRIAALLVALTLLAGFGGFAHPGHAAHGYYQAGELEWDENG